MDVCMDGAAILPLSQISVLEQNHFYVFVWCESILYILLREADHLSYKSLCRKKTDFIFGQGKSGSSLLLVYFKSSYSLVQVQFQFNSSLKSENANTTIFFYSDSKSTYSGKVHQDPIGLQHWA